MPDGLDLKGLPIPADDARQLLHVDVAAWRAELPEVEDFLARFGTRLPKRMTAQLARTRERLGG